MSPQARAEDSLFGADLVLCKGITMCLSFSPFEAQNSLFLLPVQVRSTSRLDETRIKCMHQRFSSSNVRANNKKKIFTFIIYLQVDYRHIILHFFRSYSFIFYVYHIIIL